MEDYIYHTNHFSEKIKYAEDYLQVGQEEAFQKFEVKFLVLVNTTLIPFTKILLNSQRLLGQILYPVGDGSWEPELSRIHGE